MFEVREWSGVWAVGSAHVAKRSFPTPALAQAGTATAPTLEHHFPCDSKKMALIITSPSSCSSLEVSHSGTDKPSANSSSLRKAEPEVLRAVTIMQLI